MQKNRCVFHDIKTILIQDWEQQLEAHDHISVLMRTVVKNYVEFPIAVIDVLQNGAAISTNAYEGLRTVDLIERIYEKVRG